MTHPAPWRRRIIRFAALAIFVATPPVRAGSLTVAPVRVTLSDVEKVQTVTVRNNGTTAARVQLRVYAWRQVGGEDVLEDTQDILVNPVAFELTPGADQVARFGLRVGQGGVEKSYRVVLDEVPGDRASRPGHVRTLLRIVMPIFVAPAVSAPRLTWSKPEGAGLTLHNRGNAHVKIGRVTVTLVGGQPVASREMSTYLLAGTTRTVPLDAATPPNGGERLTVYALTDATATPVCVDRESDANPIPQF